VGFDLCGLCGGGLMKENIKSVRVFNSETNIYNGEDIGHGFAVIINPMPTDAADITQIGDDIWVAQWLK